MKENRTLHRGKAGKKFLFQYPKMPFFGSLIHPNSKSSQSQKNMQNHLNRHRKKQNHKKRGKRESRTVGLLEWTAREISTVCFFLQIVTLSEREERRRRRKKKNTLFGGGEVEIVFIGRLKGEEIFARGHIRGGDVGPT